MSDEDNVLSFATRRPVKELEEQRVEAEKRHEKELSEADARHKAMMLEFIDNIRARIEDDSVGGFCFSGLNDDQKCFLSATVLNAKQMKVTDYLAYAGNLSALALDVTDLANVGPHMTPEGKFFALGPLEELTEEDE